jgi:hypothetical protein
MLVSVMELSELLILPLVPGRNVTKAPLAAGDTIPLSCGTSGLDRGLVLGGSNRTLPLFAVSPGRVMEVFWDSRWFFFSGSKTSSAEKLLPNRWEKSGRACEMLWAGLLEINVPGRGPEMSRVLSGGLWRSWRRRKYQNNRHTARPSNSRSGSKTLKSTGLKRRVLLLSPGEDWWPEDSVRFVPVDPLSADIERMAMGSFSEASVFDFFDLAVISTSGMESFSVAGATPNSVFVVELN